MGIQNKWYHHRWVSVILLLIAFASVLTYAETQGDGDSREEQPSSCSDDVHHHDSSHDHSTCGHDHDDGHDHHTCEHDDHHDSNHDSDHSTCGHDHTHDDRHSTATKFLHDRWHATFTDDDGDAHKHLPMVFRAQGIAYLTMYNIDAALLRTTRAVLFLYRQGCGLCEDAHAAFVSLSKNISHASTLWASNQQNSGSDSSTNSFMLGQLDMTPPEGGDEDQEDAAARGRVSSWVRTIGALHDDYPMVLVLQRDSRNKATSWRVDGYRGLWAAVDVAALIAPHLVPHLTHREVADNMQQQQESVATGVFQFENGTLVC